MDAVMRRRMDENVNANEDPWYSREHVAITGLIGSILYGCLVCLSAHQLVQHFKSKSRMQRQVLHWILFLTSSLGIVRPLIWATCEACSSWMTPFLFAVCTNTLELAATSLVLMFLMELLVLGMVHGGVSLLVTMKYGLGFINAMVIIWVGVVFFNAKSFEDTLLGHELFFKGRVYNGFLYTWVTIIFIVGLLMTLCTRQVSAVFKGRESVFNASFRSFQLPAYCIVATYVVRSSFLTALLYPAGQRFLFKTIHFGVSYFFGILLPSFLSIISMLYLIRHIISKSHFVRLWNEHVVQFNTQKKFSAEHFNRRDPFDSEIGIHGNYGGYPLGSTLVLPSGRVTTLKPSEEDGGALDEEFLFE